MAILTPDQLADLRQQFVRAMGPTPVDFTKATVNEALQAVEDWFEANRAALSAAIDAGSSPYTFTGQQKKALVAFWLLRKAGREGA